MSTYDKHYFCFALFDATINMYGCNQCVSLNVYMYFKSLVSIEMIPQTA